METLEKIFSVGVGQIVVNVENTPEKKNAVHQSIAVILELILDEDMLPSESVLFYKEGRTDFYASLEWVHSGNGIFRINDEGIDLGEITKKLNDALPVN